MRNSREYPPGIPWYQTHKEPVRNDCFWFYQINRIYLVSFSSWKKRTNTWFFSRTGDGRKKWNTLKSLQTYIIRTRTFLYYILLLLLLLASSSSLLLLVLLLLLLLLLGKWIRLILNNIAVTILKSEILDQFVLSILKSEFLNSVTRTKPKYYKEDNLNLL